MSSFWGTCCGDVLYLTYEETQAFIDAYRIKHPEDEDIIEDALCGVEYLQASDGTTLDLRSLSYDDVSVSGIWFRDYDGDEVDVPDDITVLFANQQRHCSPFGAVWESEEDLIDHYKSMIHSYLPKDFDWHNHIGWIEYAVFA